jgi:hypothetical protein
VVSTGSNVALTAPTSVAVLPSGDLVVGDASSVDLISGSNSQPLSFGANIALGSPYGVALDQSGNVYVSDNTNHAVYALNLSSPAAQIEFPGTTARTSTSAETETTAVYNSGNEALALTGLALDSGDTNFAFTSGSSSPECTATSTVDASAACYVSDEFTPGLTASATALTTGTVTLTGNAPGIATLVNTGANQTATFGASSSQTIALSGMASAALATAQTITFNNPSAATSVNAGAQITLSATATSGLPVSFSLDSQSTGSVTIGTAAVSSGITTATLTITGAGTIIIDANQAGGANGATTYSAAPLAVSATINAALNAQTITFNNPSAAASDNVGSQITLSATATSGLPVSFGLDATSTGTVTIGTASVSGGITTATLTITSAGTIILDANQAGNTEYSPAPKAVSATITAPTPGFTISAANPTLTVRAGQYITDTITVTALNGFDSTITFTCTGLPAGGGCYTQSTVTPPGSTSTTLMIVTAAESASLGHNSNPLFPVASLAVAFCCLLGFRKRRALQIFVLLAVSVIGLSLFTGCGASTQSTVSQVVVTGQSGSETATTSIAISVTK